MANLWFGKSGVGGLWSDTSNWWTDSGRTGPAGAIPTTSDTAILDTQSGTCTISSSTACFSVSAGVYNSTLQIDATLTFRSSLDIDSAAATVNFGVSGKIRYDAISNTGTLRPKQDLVIPELILYSNTGTNRQFYIRDQICTLTVVTWDIQAAGDVLLRNESIEVFIDGYSVTGGGAGTADIFGVTNALPMWFRTDVDMRDFGGISGYLGFGYDSSMTVSLRSDVDFTYGTRWYFENHSSSDITIAVDTPDGQGGLRLTSSILYGSYGSGDTTLDFSGAAMELPSAYSYYPASITTNRDDESAALRINWGDDNDFGFRQTVSLIEVTEFLGGDTTLNNIYVQGTTSQYYYGPDRVGSTDPVNTLLPCNIFVVQYTSSIHTFYFNYDVDIGGSVSFTPSFNRQDVQFINLPASQATAQIRGNFTYTSTAGGYTSNIEFFRDVILLGDLTVSAIAGTTTVDFNVAAVDIYGDISFNTQARPAQAAGSVVTVHTQKNGDRDIFFGTTSLTKLDGTWRVVQDDITDGGGSFAAQFRFGDTDHAEFDTFELINEVDALMEVGFDDSTSFNWTFDNLTIQGRGDVCATPISDQYTVSLVSRSAPTVTKFDLNIGGTNAVTLAKFTAIDNIGTSIPANDGTCFDGNGNAGVDFTVVAPSLGVCDTDLFFDAIIGGELPAAQNVNIENIGLDILADVTLSGIPSWLDVTASGTGNTQSLSIQPNTVAMSEGVYTDSFDVLSAGAARSPVTVEVTYTLTYAVVPEPTPDEVDFLVRRDELYPDPQLVDVVNIGAGFTEVMEEIEVSGVPTWLDVDINPPSSSSSSSPYSSSSSGEGFSDYQQLLLTVNATGLALPLGTYTADLVIDAANAENTSTLAVTLVVEVISIETDPSSLTFEMKEASALPTNQAVELGNPSGGVLDPVNISGDPAWLDYNLSGSGNVQYVEFSINSAAQALISGTYIATLTLDADNADVPTTFVVTLNILARSFLLTPDEAEFTPAADWSVPGTRTSHAIQSDFAITDPVTITGAPSWLSVVLDSTNLANQLITLSVIQVEFDKLDDPDDYAVILLVTAEGVGAEATLPLTVIVTQPAFFRRTSCVMDFVPKVEGTLVEECDVPPPPPPLPVIPTPPPAGGGSYQVQASFAGAPCLTCEFTVEYDDELGYSDPTIILECTEHGCYPDSVDGVYCEGSNSFVSSITLDECGHVCEVVCEAPV